MRKSLDKSIFNISHMKTIVFISFILISFLAKANENTLIRVKAEVDKSVITIGDRITYSLTIDHHKSIRIEQPGPGANLGQFEIKNYQIHDPIEKNEIVTQLFEYEISVFDTGKYIIPPFPVAFFESDTSRKFQIIQSEPIEINVQSVLSAEDRQLRDIKPPQDIPFNLGKWLKYGLITLIILLLTFFIIYYLRQRKKGIPLFRKEKIRPAHEIAFEELETIKSKWQDMLHRGQAKTLFTEISEILRRYLENRFFIKALEETTFEISWSLQEMEIDEIQQKNALAVLELSDLVKFAKHFPEEKETLSILDYLEIFIENTKLVFESVEHEIEITEADTKNEKEEKISNTKEIRN